jgi:cyclase
MISSQENIFSSVQDVKLIAPNISFTENLTLYRGNREIRILFLGRGHTGGDIFVHMPRERVLITGDFIGPSLPYMGDGYFLEWIETLEQLKSLEFDWIIPAHGEPFQDRRKIDYLQSFLRDFWERVQKLKQSGVSAQEAANRIDMRDHSNHYPEIKNIGIHPHATLRAYELLEGVRQ